MPSSNLTLRQQTFPSFMANVIVVSAYPYCVKRLFKKQA